MEGDVSSGMVILKTLGALGAVLGMIFALSWFVRKYLKPERWVTAPSSNIRVIQSFSIAPKKQLMIVEVENQKLLLGVCDSSISCLGSLDHSRSEVRHASL